MPLYQKFHNSSFCFIFIYFPFLFFFSLKCDATIKCWLIYLYTHTDTSAVQQLIWNWFSMFLLYSFVCFVKLFQIYKSTAEIKLPTKVSSKEELIIRNQLNISLLKLISRDENQLRNNQIQKKLTKCIMTQRDRVFYLKIILH